MQQPSERKLISLAMATTERLALVHSTQLPVHAFSHYLCYINIYTERFIYVYIYIYVFVVQLHVHKLHTASVDKKPLLARCRNT